MEEAPSKVRWEGAHRTHRSMVGRRHSSAATALVIGEAPVRGNEQQLALENHKPSQSVRQGSNTMKASWKGGSPCGSVSSMGCFTLNVSMMCSGANGGHTQEGTERGCSQCGRSRKREGAESR
jgi:hypothetical protein